MSLPSRPVLQTPGNLGHHQSPFTLETPLLLLKLLKRIHIGPQPMPCNGHEGHSAQMRDATTKPMPSLVLTISRETHGGARALPCCEKESEESTVPPEQL